MIPSESFRDSIIYKALTDDAERLKQMHLRQLFQDEERFASMSIFWDELLFDFSKNRIDSKVWKNLHRLAEEMQLAEAFEGMLRGDKINVTEGRPVLHTALRNFSDSEVLVNGKDVMPDVREVLQKMKIFSDQIISGEKRGYTGKQFTDVVNIGIGGSDLGPVMVCEALKHYHVPHLKVHFVSNVDGSHITETIKNLNPETTLFLIASKTFTTQETMANAHTAKQWFLNTAQHEQHVAAHFVALSTAEKEVTAFGIDRENMFVFWDWVGGRYSLWSAIGLSICLAIGYELFEDLLYGAHQVDNLTKSVEPEHNIPLTMALLGVWYNEWFDAHTHAVIPYDQYLHRFTAFLQQADMESNGKSVQRNGKRADYATGPVVWGEPGTNGQHAFFQLMHQGTQLIPADFIVAATPLHNIMEQHHMLLSNCLAQTEALMNGKTEEEVRTELRQKGMDNETINKHLPYRVFEGNRPTNTIVIDQLTPYNLGRLIAIYEHKIFYQGILWNVFSFDQWGVELGKKLAAEILPEWTSKETLRHHDSSTGGLIQYIRNLLG